MSSITQDIAQMNHVWKQNQKGENFQKKVH